MIQWLVQGTILLYLIVMSVVDIKKKQIPILPGVILLGVTVTTLLVVGTDLIGIAMGMLVGGILFGISYVSRGGIGQADALVYAVTGTVLGFYRNLEVLLISLIMAAVVGGVLLAVKHVGRKYRMPFVPFTMVAYGMVMWI